MRAGEWPSFEVVWSSDGLCESEVSVDPEVRLIVRGAHWLKGNTILAAFEIEATTSIYSGLLRMSDLLALQPNLDLALYLVAPDERRTKVQQEIVRPTFAYREKPLPRVCGFVGFSKLMDMDKVEGIRRLGLAASLKAEFLKTNAEYFGDPDAEE